MNTRIGIGLGTICVTGGLVWGLASVGQNLQTPPQAPNGASNAPAILVGTQRTNHITLDQLQGAVRTNLFSKEDLAKIVKLLEEDESMGVPAHTHILITNVMPCTLELSDLQECQTLLNRYPATLDGSRIEAVTASRANSVRFAVVRFSDKSTRRSGGEFEMGYFWKPPNERWQTLEISQISYRY